MSSGLRMQAKWCGRERFLLMPSPLIFLQAESGRKGDCEIYASMNVVGGVTR